MSAVDTKSACSVATLQTPRGEEVDHHDLMGTVKGFEHDRIGSFERRKREIGDGCAHHGREPLFDVDAEAAGEHGQQGGDHGHPDDSA